MSCPTFSYDVTTNTGRVRLLVADTNRDAYIWTDAEVQAALDMTGSASLFISGQAAQTGAFLQSPAVPLVYSLYRAAALLLRSLAANKARLASVTELLDVKLSVGTAAKALRDQASDYDEYEANRGQFIVAEMVDTTFAMSERWWKQLARTQS